MELLVGLPQQGAADHQDAGHADDRGPRGQKARGRREQPDAHKAQCACPPGLWQPWLPAVPGAGSMG